MHECMWFCQPFTYILHAVYTSYLPSPSGVSAAPSIEVNMSIKEFIQRLTASGRHKYSNIAYHPHEHYYMQAQVPPHLSQQLYIEELLMGLELSVEDERPAAGQQQGSNTATAPPPVTQDTSSQLQHTPCGSSSSSCSSSTRDGMALRTSQAPRIWVSPRGSVSPLHYDLSESFLIPLQGHKRMLFFSPDQLQYLYPYPETHLLRRRSRVNVCNPDLVKHPLFSHATATEVVLQPGDVVLFGSKWAHYTEALDSCVSVTFRVQTAP